MRIIKKFFNKIFFEIYQRSSSIVKRKLFLGLREIYPNHPFIKSLYFRGKFDVSINRKYRFRIINYGGIIEERTLRDGLFNTWENESGHIWKQLCPLADVIFDIGANTGIYSLVAKTINPNSKVYAFEPSPRNFKKLNRNNEINNFNIHSEQLAVSNETAEKIFYDQPNENQTTSSLLPDIILNRKDYSGDLLKYSVKTITLEDYIRKNNIKNIDLVKIDVELHEAEAIEGLGPFLYEFKPVILLEVLTTEVADKLNNLVDLEQFNLFHLQRKGAAKQLNKFEIKSDSRDNWEWNFLLFHKNQEEKIKKFTDLYLNE